MDFKIFVATGVLVACVCESALGIPITPASFSGNETVLTFESISSGTPITIQFVADGVVFSPGLFGDPFVNSTIQGSAEATNFSNASTITNPIIALFPDPVARVGFLIAGTSSPDDIRLGVFRDDLEVEVLELTTGGILPGGSLHSAFIGVEQLLGIDRIEISNPPDNGPFSIDDFRFETVPEPGALPLCCVACLVILIRFKRWTQPDQDLNLEHLVRSDA